MILTPKQEDDAKQRGKRKRVNPYAVCTKSVGRKGEK